MWTESPSIRGLLNNLNDGVFFVTLEGKITFWNSAAERISGIDASRAIGECCHTLLTHIDQEGADLCQGGCNFQCSRPLDWKGQREAFLRHANGHRIPVVLNVAPLADEAGRVIGGMESFSDRSVQVAALQRLRELESLVHTDPLTGVGNRRAVERILERKIDEHARYGWPFGVLFVDLDEFKKVNDVYGHEAGDLLLRSVGRTLEHGLRASDFVGRWGGEEFVLVVSDVGEGALRLTAERFRVLIEKTVATLDGFVLGATASVGATVALKTDTVTTLVDRADRLMYVSKFSGKNRVTLGNTGQ
jgi:diguanylate cyclase (GGDEF)-like protein/PAS domain S-box-containing protein